MEKYDDVVSYCSHLVSIHILYGKLLPGLMWDSKTDVSHAVHVGTLNACRSLSAQLHVVILH